MGSLGMSRGWRGSFRPNECDSRSQLHRAMTTHRKVASQVLRSIVSAVALWGLVGAAITIVVAWTFAYLQIGIGKSRTDDQSLGGTWVLVRRCDRPGLVQLGCEPRFSTTPVGMTGGHLGGLEDWVPSWSGFDKLTDTKMGRGGYFVLAAGWPYPALFCDFLNTRYQSTSNSRVEYVYDTRWGIGLPYRVRSVPGYTAHCHAAFPLWPLAVGFTADTVVFGMLAGTLWTASRYFPVARRRRRGQCVRCGYDLVYRFADGCPECGWNRD